MLLSQDVSLYHNIPCITSLSSLVYSDTVNLAADSTQTQSEEDLQALVGATPDTLADIDLAKLEIYLDGDCNCLNSRMDLKAKIEWTQQYTCGQLGSDWGDVLGVYNDVIMETMIEPVSGYTWR